MLSNTINTLFNLLSRVSSFLTTIRGLVGGHIALLLFQSLDDELGQVVVAVVTVSASLVQTLDGGLGNPANGRKSRGDKSREVAHSRKFPRTLPWKRLQCFDMPFNARARVKGCLLYTSDAADER